MNVSHSPISPIIPEHGLFWDGFPLFHIHDFSPDFSGKIFFVLGQGLGDHLNGFRAIFEIRLRFQKASLIVYADLRWEELVRRMDGVEIRWFPKALEVRSKEGTNDPYALAHSEIRKEMDAAPASSFLGYDHFPMPDRHARGEATIQATLRTVGLSLGKHLRPFVPMKKSDLLWADEFLKRNGLQSGSYAVIAPYTWENKRWPKDFFSITIDLLYRKLGIRSLVIAYPEMGTFENEGALCAYDLSLSQIAALLSRSGVYLGLDSGLSHMAAALDLPSLELFIEKKVMPFEVRACSPFFLYNVESFFLDKRIPEPESVFASISFIWTNRDHLSSVIPLCPACRSRMQYIQKCSAEVIDFMCVCGTSLTTPNGDNVNLSLSSRANSVDEKEAVIGKTTHVSLEAGSDLSSIISLISWEKRLKDSSDIETVEVFYEIPSEDKSCSDVQDLSPRINWRMDGIFYWIERMGYRPLSFSVSLKRAVICIAPFVSKIKPVSVPFTLPWGGTILKINSIDQYLKWYSFESWGKPQDLVGIVKSMSSLGYKKDALEAAWVAFRANPGLRSFRWLVKSYWAFYIKRD